MDRHDTQTMHTKHLHSKNEREEQWFNTELLAGTAIADEMTEEFKVARSIWARNGVRCETLGETMTAYRSPSAGKLVITTPHTTANAHAIARRIDATRRLPYMITLQNITMEFAGTETGQWEIGIEVDPRTGRPSILREARVWTPGQERIVRAIESFPEMYQRFEQWLTDSVDAKSALQDNAAMHTAWRTLKGPAENDAWARGTLYATPDAIREVVLSPQWAALTLAKDWKDESMRRFNLALYAGNTEKSGECVWVEGDFDARVGIVRSIGASFGNHNTPAPLEDAEEQALRSLVNLHAQQLATS